MRLFIPSTTKKIIKSLNFYLAQYRLAKKKLTDGNGIQGICSDLRRNQIRSYNLPNKKSKGGWKITSLIRKNNERLRASKQIVPTKDKSGLSDNFSLTSVFEKDLKEPNTVKSIFLKTFLASSVQDLNLEIQPPDLQDKTDLTVLVRERTKGSKLETAFAKRTVKVVKEALTKLHLPDPSKKINTANVQNGISQVQQKNKRKRSESL